MNYKTNLTLIGMLLLTLFVTAQAPVHKELPAKRTTQKVKIDGLLDDAGWKDAAIMNNLFEFRPNVGTTESYETKTETYLMYNDEGFFFGGYCHERTRDSISSEPVRRDGFGPKFNKVGFTWSDNGTEVIFAKRKVNSIENIVSVKYNFTNMMSINLRIRHYFSSVDNKEFFILEMNGSLKPNTIFTSNTNQNVNFFNADMVYAWQFAPASFFNVVWKNAVYDFTDQVEKNYLKNFTNTMESDQNNNISLNVIYFLDYLQLKKKNIKS